jgi:FimV-like protein
MCSYNRFPRFLRPIATALLAFSLLARPVQAGGGLPGEVAIPWTPVRAILPDYCGPAALTNVLRHWGRPADQASIGQAVFDRQRGGTLAGDLILWARQAGLSATSCSGSRDDLRRWLAAGLPVIVLQDLSPRDRRGHFRVVVGYSDVKRQFLVCDCTESSLCSLDYDQFDDLWFHFENWYMLAAPPERAGTTSTGEAENPILHFDLAEAYLRRGDRDAARQHLQEVVRLRPGHRTARKLLAALTRSDTRSPALRADAIAPARPLCLGNRGSSLAPGDRCTVRRRVYRGLTAARAAVGAVLPARR